VVDGRFAARLIDQHVRVLRGGLTVEEREYASRYKPPLIEVGTQPDGGRLLRVLFGGGVTMTDWDGTQEERCQPSMKRRSRSSGSTRTTSRFVGDFQPTDAFAL
jgi:hypothetical protein